MVLKQKLIRLTENLQYMQNHLKIAQKLPKIALNCMWKFFLMSLTIVDAKIVDFIE